MYTTDFHTLLYGYIQQNFVSNSAGTLINNPNISLSIPTTLQEALQLILFWNSLLWQTGHKLVGLGRLDKVLEQYEMPDNAEELIEDFLKTLHSNYKQKSNKLLGDTGQTNSWKIARKKLLCES